MVFFSLSDKWTEFEQGRGRERASENIKINVYKQIENKKKINKKNKRIVQSDHQ